jgi:hypothetical protein
MATATAHDGTILTFTASHGNGNVIDVDVDLDALWNRTQARADREDDGKQATPHYVITLWHSGTPDQRELHVYGNTQRGHAQKPEFVNRPNFDAAYEDAINGPTIGAAAATVADALVTVLRVLNAVEDLAYQQPGSAYQHTVDALKATLAVMLGSRTKPNHDAAETIYEGILDSGESATYILMYNGYRIA